MQLWKCVPPPVHWPAIKKANLKRLKFTANVPDSLEQTWLSEPVGGRGTCRAGRDPLTQPRGCSRLLIMAEFSLL